MKIQFISNYSQLYGANKVLLLIVNHFNSIGYEVSVLLPSKGGMSEALEDLKIPYTIIPYFSSFLYVKKSLKFLLLPILLMINCVVFPIIYTKIKKFNPNLIYSNTSAENIGILVSKLLKKKHISHIHEFMLLDHGAYFLAGIEAKQKYIDKSNGIIYVTKCVADYVNLGQPLSPNKTIIYNGITSSDLLLKNKILTSQINFGIVGILDSGKGQDKAIEYFNKIVKIYTNSRLHIFGDKNGKYKDMLINLVKSLNLEDKVIFHGFVKNTSEIYNQIDILFMFSRSEGFGLVTVEAMLHGIPVIGYNNAGTAEIIENNVTGYLFDNYPTFINNLNLLLNENNYNRIRSTAYRVAKEKYDVNTFCNKIEQFVCNIYQNKNEK